MKYKFPVITSINDVLPHIKDHPEFIVAEKEGYKIIQYTHMENKTFEGDDLGAAIRRECRGLTFDSQGKLIRRPFHKFFNVNEKPETSIDMFSLDSFMALDKLDGSMIAPIPFEDGFRLGTKMGLTDTAMRAEVFIADKENYSHFIKLILEENITPIFEFLDHEVPIVVNHEESKLILLAARHNNSGEYVNRQTLQEWASAFAIPLVVSYFPVDRQFIENVKAKPDIEGYVIRLENGHMAKVKTDWYVNLHRVKDKLSSPRHTIMAMLENNMDDVYAVVDGESQKKIAEFEENFWNRVHNISQSIMQHYVTAVSGFVDRKDFAINCPPDLPRWMKGAIFSMMDGSDSYTLALDLIKKNLTQDSKFNEFNREVLQLEGNIHATRAA